MSSDEETRADEDRAPHGDADEVPSGSDNMASDHQSTPSSSFVEHSAEAALPADSKPHDGFDSNRLPQTFANYTIVQKLGEGGAGIVFRATPLQKDGPAGGYPQIALKMIRPEFVSNSKAIRRFEKESRLHAEIKCENVTRHLEFGDFHGIFFIASEFVEGFSLDRIVPQLRQLPAKQILRIVADLLTALSAMHSKGVIHRDVKPANVIATFQNSNNTIDQPGDLGDFVIAKLTDFGLARHIDQSQSLAMTRQHATLGTPTYMAPEQHSGSDTIDARADVYSTGVTLYHLLAGRPPFNSKSQAEMAEMHRIQRPMPLTFLRKDISHAINSVVMKALEKEPNLRYQNADEMLADVQLILNDQPAAIRIYPATPNTSDASVKRYDFQWTLDATPKELWPLVSDTDRFNRAIGLPAPEFRYDHSGKHLKIFAEAKLNGLSFQWREHPFQWICEREMSILREFELGPFEWVTSTVELHPLADHKTRLLHRFQVKPRGLFGKLFAPIQFNILIRRSLEKVYPRLERLANDQSCRFGCDVPFEGPPKISRRQKRRLTARVDVLARALGDIVLAERFGNLIQQLADPVAARLRPLTLAAKLNCSNEQSLQVCWSSIEAGLLNLSWDIICPVCKIAADNIRSIDQIESHSHCKVCNLEFETDFAETVEMIFSVHPDIRNIQLKTWCIGGPYHAPHVLAQNRLLKGQHVDVGVDLVEGQYVITGPQLEKTGELDVSQNASESRAVFAIGGASHQALPELRSGPACVKVDNQSNVEVLVRLARNDTRTDAMTAAMAQRHPLFKKLFPDDIRQTEQLVAVSNLHLLAIRHTQADSLLDRVGDVQVRHYWKQLQQKFPVAQKRCTIEECNNESMLVSFVQLDDLLASLDQLTADVIDGSGIPIGECCFVIQSGEVMTGSSENQPTAFGKTIRQTKKLMKNLSAKALLIPGELYTLLHKSTDIEDDANAVPELPLRNQSSPENLLKRVLSRFELMDTTRLSTSDSDLVKFSLRDF